MPTICSESSTPVKRILYTAHEAFDQALKIAPNSKTTHNNLGNLYVAEGKFDLAEKEFAGVLKAAPADRDANYNLGLLLMAKGNPLASRSSIFRACVRRAWRRS